MKRNWMIVLTVMLLLTLSCRLPFSRSSRAADQTIAGDEPMTDQGLYDVGIHFVSPEGVTVVIPPGETHPDATPRQISVTALPGEQSDLPEGFVQTGDVFYIDAGSEPLLQPAIMSLPIPPEVPHEEIIGLTTFSEEQGSWVLVPAFVDSEAGMVTTTVPGFSRWSIASIGRLSAHCSLYHVGPQCYAQEKGAWIEVTNQHILNQDINPPLSGARYSQYTTNYGVCIKDYELDDPSAEQNWRNLKDWCLTVSDYASSRTGTVSTMRWLLPAGRYQLVEYVFASERNPGVPTYQPVYVTNYRPLSTLELRDGQTVSFSNNGNFPGWLGWGVASPDSISEISSEEAVNDVDERLAWVGNWEITFSAESMDCQGSYQCSPTIGAITSGYRFAIFESKEELVNWLNEYNKNYPVGAASVTMVQNFPYITISTPFHMEILGEEHYQFFVGRWIEGSYNPTTDTFSGQFKLFWNRADDDYARYSGTWTATRQGE